MAQETQTEPKRVRVFGPDNKYYSFPPGTTKDTAVSFFKKRGISSPESVAAPQAKTPTVSPKPEPEKAPEEKKTGYAAFGRGVEQSFGIDPKKMTEAFHKGGASAQWHEMGAEFTHNLSQFAIGVLKDPLEISKAIEGLATGVETGGKKLWSGLTEVPMGSEESKERIFGGAGEMLGSIGQVLGGGEGVKRLSEHASIVDGGLKATSEIAKKTGVPVEGAVQAAHRSTSHPVLRALVDRKGIETSYLHNKGIEVGRKITDAAKAVDEEVKIHAEGISKEIDTKVPTGVVDASAEEANIVKEFKDVVKAPEKVHPALSTMVKDAKATAPNLWSWEKARQFRSSIGRAISKVGGPQKAVLTREYRSLTNKLGRAAKQYGLEKSWTHYNELASKVDKEFADIIDDVRESSLVSGRKVARKLGSDRGLTIELARNLAKYSKDKNFLNEVMRYVTRSKKIMKSEGGFTKSLWGYAYRGGAPVTIGLRMAGAGYLPAVAGGFLTGYAVTQVLKTIRALKLSGDLAEHILDQRELPGRMKFKEGKFPGEGASQLPEGEPPAKPSALKEAPQLPAPKVGASKVEPTKVEPEKHGTGKLAEQAKARERVSKSRTLAKRTKESEAADAQARAQATHLDVSALQIPEMEEYLRTKNPTAFSGLQKLRKAKGLTDEMYIEGLKYYILEGLEE